MRQLWRGGGDTIRWCRYGIICMCSSRKVVAAIVVGVATAGTTGEGDGREGYWKGARNEKREKRDDKQEMIKFTMYTNRPLPPPASGAAGAIAAVAAHAKVKLDTGTQNQRRPPTHVYLSFPSVTEFLACFSLGPHFSIVEFYCVCRSWNRLEKSCVRNAHPSCAPTSSP